jgi:hypothetical protein
MKFYGITEISCTILTVDLSWQDIGEANKCVKGIYVNGGRGEEIEG